MKTTAVNRRLFRFARRKSLSVIFGLLCAASWACGRSKSELATRSEEPGQIAKECPKMNVSASLQSGGTNPALKGPSWVVRCQSGGVDEEPPTVSASPNGGAFGVPQLVTLTSNEQTARIYYTVDGVTNPDGNSAVYTGPILVSANTTLKFIAVDQAGNISSVGQAAFIIDQNLPTVSVITVSRLFVSGDRSRGPSQSLDIHWTANYPGSYSIELGGTVLNGIPQRNSGQKLLEGNLAQTGGTVDTAQSTLIGADFGVGPNSVYIYLTNQYGHTGVVQLRIEREDTPPQTVSDKAAGDYASMQPVTLTMLNEPDGVGYIDYTTDGSDPSTAPIETDASRCNEMPFRPRSGYRCRIQGPNTSPILIEPYMKIGCTVGAPVSNPMSCDAGCTLGTDCNDTIRLRYYGIDRAGNQENNQFLDFRIKMVDPRLLDPQPSSLSVNQAGSVQVTVAPADAIAEWQIAKGTGAVWNGGTVIASGGSLAAMATTVRGIPGSILSSGMANPIVIRAKDSAGRIGTTTFNLLRDDTPPLVSASQISGVYNRSILPTVTLAIHPDDPDSTTARIYYTLDGSEPNPSSANFTGSGMIDLPSSPDGTVTTQVRFYAVDPAGNVSSAQSERYAIQAAGATIGLTNTMRIPQRANALYIDNMNISTLTKWKNLNSDQVNYSINLVDLKARTDCSDIFTTDPDTGAPYLPLQIDSGEVFASGILAALEQRTLILPALAVPLSYQKPALCGFAKRAGDAANAPYAAQTLRIDIDRRAPVVSGFVAGPRRLAVTGTQATSIRFRADEPGVYNVWKMTCPGKDANGAWLTPATQDLRAILSSGTVTTAGVELNVSLSASLFTDDTAGNSGPECIAITVTDAMGNTSATTATGGAYYSRPAGFDPNGGEADSDTEGWFYRRDAATSFNLASVDCNGNNLGNDDYKACRLTFNRAGNAEQSLSCPPSGPCTSLQLGASGNSGSVGTGANLAVLPLQHIESVGGNGGGGASDFGWLQSYITQGHSVSVTGTTSGQKLYFHYNQSTGTTYGAGASLPGSCMARAPIANPWSYYAPVYVTTGAEFGGYQDWSEGAPACGGFKHFCVQVAGGGYDGVRSYWASQWAVSNGYVTQADYNQANASGYLWGAPMPDNFSCRINWEGTSIGQRSFFCTQATNIDAYQLNPCAMIHNGYWTLFYDRYYPSLFGNYSVTASGSTTANYAVDWQTAQIKTHSYQGSKIFTYVNPHGVKKNLQVSCEKSKGCVAAPF